MIEAESEGHLIERLRDLLPIGGASVLLGVDGNEGAGKSMVASSIAAALSAPVIHLDDYAQPNKGRYPDCIRYDDLRADFDRHSKTSRVIVVEGVCLRQVLEHIGLKPRVSAYVKLLNARGRWVGSVACDESPVRPGELGAADATAPGSIERDVRAYHAQFKPVSSADIIYTVVRQYA